MMHPSATPPESRPVFASAAANAGNSNAPGASTTATEDAGNLVVLPMGANLGEVARALNAIGATPRDLIAIFQAIKAAGALQGELVVL